MKKYKLGILGIGKMGSSILTGILKSALYKPNEIAIYDINKKALEMYQDKDINILDNEKKLLENSQMILLAIKPQMLSNLKTIDFEICNCTIISIVAGKSITDLENIFGKQKFIRVMPNTPALINKGATAISRTSDVEDNLFEEVMNIFLSVGCVEEIPDNLMNEIIPVNGSMPAFLYYFAQSFIDKAVKNGISYEVAKRLVCESIIGSAEMIKSSGKDIDTLINDVCSPKGATLEGLNIMKVNNIKETLEKVSEATIKRAYELSKI